MTHTHTLYIELIINLTPLIKMARITTINSFEKAWKVKGNQLSAQQLLNENMYLKTTGWSKVRLTDEFKEDLVDKIVEIAGGHHDTKRTIRMVLNHRQPQHWALDRIFIEKYGKKVVISYCAGQDYTHEMAQLRKYLKVLA